MSENELTFTGVSVGTPTGERTIIEHAPEWLRARAMWTCIVSAELANDPLLQVGEIVWLEAKEPTLMRPIFRRRVLVISRTMNLHSSFVTYEFQEKPQLQDGFDNARTVVIDQKGATS